jgi:hypothetical protein
MPLQIYLLSQINANISTENISESHFISMMGVLGGAI